MPFYFHRGMDAGKGGKGLRLQKTAVSSFLSRRKKRRRSRPSGAVEKKGIPAPRKGEGTTWDSGPWGGKRGPPTRPGKKKMPAGTTASPFRPAAGEKGENGLCRSFVRKGKKEKPPYPFQLDGEREGGKGGRE